MESGLKLYYAVSAFGKQVYFGYRQAAEDSREERERIAHKIVTTKFGLELVGDKFSLDLDPSRENDYNVFALGAQNFYHILTVRLSPEPVPTCNKWAGSALHRRARLYSRALEMYGDDIRTAFNPGDILTRAADREAGIPDTATRMPTMTAAKLDAGWVRMTIEAPAKLAAEIIALIAS